MSLHVFPSASETTWALARYIISLAAESIKTNNYFSLVLSGGNTPKKLYETLSSPEFRDAIDWQRVKFYFGDERYVPETDDASNYKMAKETLLQPLYISETQVFKINTRLGMQEASIDYQKKISGNNDITTVQFDLVLLGMGDNVHTASLFPGTDILSDTLPAIRTVLIPGTEQYRITMNAPLINQARHRCFFVLGSTKALAVHQVFQGKKDTQLFPAQLIDTDNTTWFMDEAAASYL